jgi:hypothetical protein
VSPPRGDLTGEEVGQLRGAPVGSMQIDRAAQRALVCGLQAEEHRGHHVEGQHARLLIDIHTPALRPARQPLRDEATDEGRGVGEARGRKGGMEEASVPGMGGLIHGQQMGGPAGVAKDPLPAAPMGEGGPLRLQHGAVRLRPQEEHDGRLAQQRRDDGAARGV